MVQNLNRGRRVPLETELPNWEPQQVSQKGIGRCQSGRNGIVVSLSVDRQRKVNIGVHWHSIGGGERAIVVVCGVNVVEHIQSSLHVPR
jgi:hypothetical protein